MSEPQHDQPQSGGNVTKRSLWPLSTSAILIVAGVFCMLIPFISPIAGPLFIGRMLIFCGLAHALQLFAARDRRTALRRLAPAVVPILIGITVLTNEGPHARSLTVLLMIFFVIDGYFKVIASVERHPARISNLSLGSAGLSFFLAVFLAATFPNSPTWLLALFLGVDLISMGIVTASFDEKRAAGQPTGNGVSH